MADLARELLDKVKENFADESLNHTNVMHFVALCMETVETYKNLPGAEKKALVINTTKLAITDLVPDTKEFELLESFAEYFIDEAIEEIIEVNDGKLKLNLKNSKFFSIFLACKKCLGKA